MQHCSTLYTRDNNSSSGSYHSEEVGTTERFFYPWKCVRNHLNTFGISSGLLSDLINKTWPTSNLRSLPQNFCSVARRPASELAWPCLCFLFCQCQKHNTHVIPMQCMTTTTQMKFLDWRWCGTIINSWLWLIMVCMNYMYIVWILQKNAHLESEDQERLRSVPVTLIYIYIYIHIYIYMLEVLPRRLMSVSIQIQGHWAKVKHTCIWYGERQQKERLQPIHRHDINSTLKAWSDINDINHKNIVPFFALQPFWQLDHFHNSMFQLWRPACTTCFALGRLRLPDWLHFAAPASGFGRPCHLIATFSQGVVGLSPARIRPWC